MSETMKRVPMDEMRKFCVSALKSKGVPKKSAAAVAEIAVLTEGLGIKTHGVSCFVFSYRAIGGIVDPKAEPRIVAEKPATAAIDGEGVFGQLAFGLAVETATRKAREQGASVVSVKNTSWVGAVAPYLLDIPTQGLAAQAVCQTSTCEDCAPIGGIDAKFSTNPIALAFPAGDSMVLADFSTASLSMGKVNQMRLAGEKAPENIFMNADGELTDDPNVVADGGSILFTGGENYGHKGYALSLWCEAITAMAGGSANNPQAPSRQSLTLTVIDPGAFAGNDYYTTEMTRFVKHMKNARLRSGYDAIRLPGERALRLLAEAREQGVPLTDAQLQSLDEIAKDCGIDPLA
jgi:LDH2 family malate/lactate/ureidoglycolate dehydrogenase